MKGLGYGTIARRFQEQGVTVSEAVVRWQCLRLGIVRPDTPPVDLYRTTTFDSRVRRFTPEEDAQIVALDAEGKGTKAIGKILGRTSTSIVGRFYALAREEIRLEG